MGFTHIKTALLFSQHITHINKKINNNIKIKKQKQENIWT